MKTFFLGLLLLAPNSDLEKDTIALCEHVLFPKTDNQPNRATAQQLGKEKCFCTLYALEYRYPWAYGYFLEPICANLDTANAIAFCDNLDVGSSEWEAATSKLSERPKNEVLPYYMKTFLGLKSSGRAHYYEVFAKHQWPELVDFAVADISNNAPIWMVNHPLGWEPITVGRIARSYVRTIREGRLQ